MTKKTENIWRECEAAAWEPGKMPRAVFEDLLHLYCAKNGRCLMAPEIELKEFVACLVSRCNENGRCHLLPLKTGAQRTESPEPDGAPTDEDIQYLKNFHREYGLPFKHLGGGRFVLSGATMEGAGGGEPEA